MYRGRSVDWSGAGARQQDSGGQGGESAAGDRCGHRNGAGAAADRQEGRDQDSAGEHARTEDGRRGAGRGGPLHGEHGGIRRHQSARGHHHEQREQDDDGSAARCHVVQSALSYQISRLEREGGVLLFERTSRSVRLAAGGEVLLPRARAVLAEVELARAELAELAGVISGRLRIGMIGSAARAYPDLERTLGEFHRRHPGVEISIADTGSARMAEEVRSGLLDLAVVGLFPEQVPADLVHRLLAVEPMVAVVGRDSPLAGRATTTLAELAAATVFVDMPDTSGVRQQVDSAFARAGIARTVGVELGTSEAVGRYVGLGFGAALVPLSAAPSRREVAVLRVADQAIQHPISLIHRAPEPSSPGGRAFLRLLDTRVGPPTAR
jgi:DNA-binding transcriptional LysR family regulator